jgi:hypothetical protein
MAIVWGLRKSYRDGVDCCICKGLRVVRHRCRSIILIRPRFPPSTTECLAVGFFHIMLVSVRLGRKTIWVAGKNAGQATSVMRGKTRGGHCLTPACRRRGSDAFSWKDGVHHGGNPNTPLIDWRTSPPRDVCNEGRNWRRKQRVVLAWLLLWSKKIGAKFILLPPA